jgi:hypothetical protein
MQDTVYRNAALGEVEAGEARAGECLGHQVDGVAGPASDVGGVDGVPEPAGQAGYQRQRHVDQIGVVNRAAVLGHDGLELRER